MLYGIFYLKLTKAAYATGSKIHDHYILMSKNKFLVLTSNPVKNMKSHYITTPNIKGEQKAQYLIEHVHHYNPLKHIVSTKPEATQYFLEHKKKFKQALEVIEKPN